MKKLTFILFIISNCLLFTSCEKEESPVTLPAKPADVKLESANMGKDYRNQVYVNLTTGATTTVDNLCWDLSFDASSEGTAIYLNGGKDILIANSGHTYFQVNPRQQYTWKWDEACGNKDSLALDHCIGNNYVYIINRGRDKQAYQFRILSVNQDEYILEFSDMWNTFIKLVSIPKDHTKSMVYFSFENGGNYMNFEPALTDWHICFLRYRWIFYEFNPPLRYLVSGAFINTKFVTVAVDSSLSFYDITKNQIANLQFHSNRDVIGYDWKSPDLSNTSNVKYTIRKKVNYFIQENVGTKKLFKLRFIDFYDAQGVKGTPQFETGELN